ncbi:MAG TPA: ring-cleaving dioxygenase [Gemmatimonadaceae bacterium]|nr:ring-cleaving dioxygenase [Gemmatimonadaceae bacterium]
MTSTLGIHHVTAIAGDAQRNLDFYAGVLGMRLVKRTVNFDDPFTYHFYFGDEHGSPGSILTFFPWFDRRAGQHGVGQVAVTSLAIPAESLGWWLHRLVAAGVRHEAPVRRGDERVVQLRDPDGMMLALVAHPATGVTPGWDGGAVPAEHAIRGVHGVTLWVPTLAPTGDVLAAMGFAAVGGEEGTTRFAVGSGGAGAIVDVRDVGGFVQGKDGVGAVHHVAFRVSDDAAELALRAEVQRRGLTATAALDRHYFRSVYFREPGGVLFELATDAPGFLIDEPASALGQSLRLPSHLEHMRDRIEAALPPVHLPSRLTPESSAFAAESRD